MEMKQNQTFFHGTYSNLTPYLFLSKNIKVYQTSNIIKKLMTFKIEIWQFYDYLMNPKNGNETKGHIFPWDTFKSDILFQWSKNTKIFQLLL